MLPFKPQVITRIIPSLGLQLSPFLAYFQKNESGLIKSQVRPSVCVAPNNNFWTVW
jgi:hypothetical protein